MFNPVETLLGIVLRRGKSLKEKLYMQNIHFNDM